MPRTDYVLRSLPCFPSAYSPLIYLPFSPSVPNLGGKKPPAPRRQSRLALYGHKVANEANANMWFAIVDDDYELIPAHKCLVSTASYALGRIIYGSKTLPGMVNDTLIVDRISLEAFTQVLWHIYTGKSILSADNALEIMEKAHYYGLKDLFMECREIVIEHLISHRDRCLNVYGRLFGLEPYDDLIRQCLRVIRFDPRAVAFDQPNIWIHLSAPAVRAIIASNCINCGEVELFDALIRWAHWRNGMPPPLDETRKPAKAMRIARKLLVSAANVHRYIRWTTLTREEILFCDKIAPLFFRPQEIAGMLAALNPLAKRRSRLTAAKCYWMESDTNTNLHPAAVHAMTMFNALPPQYVATTIACGEHKHVFGYPQTGPVPNDTICKYYLLVGTGYEWRPVGPKQDIPANAVVAPGIYAKGDWRRHPLYVGRAFGRFVGVIDWFRRVCRQEVSHVNGEHCEKVSGEFQVLVAFDVRPPSHPVELTNPALKLVHDGPFAHDNFYLGRAYCMNNIVPVRINMTMFRAFCVHLGNVYMTPCYEMMRIDPHHVVWRQSRGGKFVANAVMGGRTDQGEKLYVGRTLPDRTGYWLMGKIVPRQGAMLVMVGDEEQRHSVYEILVFRRRALALEFERRVWGEYRDNREVDI